MRLFRLTATVGRSVNGYWRTSQVPTFLLDGDTQGLTSETDAERFAELMLADILGNGARATASAVEV